MMKKRFGIFLACCIFLISVLGAFGACGDDAEPGKDGLSAYEIYKKYHPEYTGTEEEWLETLMGNASGSPGKDGLSAYEIYKKYHPEYTGTEEEWLETLMGNASGSPGKDGLSAYEIYKKYHPEYAGTEEEWITDLVTGNLPENLCTVSFETSGGTEIPEQKVRYGGRIQEPETPRKDGYRFLGWKYQGRDWDFFGYTVSENMTFNALWTIEEAPVYTLWADTYRNALEVFVLPEGVIRFGDPKVTRICVERPEGSVVVAERVFGEEETAPRSWKFENLIHYDGAVSYKVLVTWAYDSNGDGVRNASRTDYFYANLLYDEYSTSQTAGAEEGKICSDFSILVPEADRIELVEAVLYRNGEKAESLSLTGKESVTAEALGNRYAYRAEFAEELLPEGEYTVKWRVRCRNYGGFVGVEYRKEEIIRTVALTA